MKITGYNSSVNGVGMPSATVKAVGDLMAHGGSGSGYKAISKALNQVQIQYEQMAEEEDKRALMSAMDIYNKGRYNILYDDQEGVMNTKLDGAAGSVMTYQQKEQKLRNDIASNLKFKTKKYQLVFEDMVNKSAQQGYQLVDRHEYQEGEKQQDVVLNNNLNNVLVMAQKNYNDEGIVKESIAEIQKYVSGRYEKMGKEYVQNATKVAASRLGKSVIEEAITRGDYDVAEKYMKEFDDAKVFTPEVRDSLEKSLFTKQKNENNMALAESLASRYGEDVGGMLAELEGTNAFGTDRLMNLAERHNVLNLAQSIINTNKAIEKANFDKVYDGALDTAAEVVNKQGYVAAMKWAEEQAGGNMTNLKALQSAVNICAKRASGAGFKGIPAGEWQAIDVMLRNGDFETEEEYMSYLDRMGADEKQIVIGRKNYNDFRQGVGNYAYKFEELKTIVMGKSSLKDNEKAKWNGAVLSTQDEISDFIIKHKRQPSKYEVMNMLSENMTKGVKLTYSSNSFWWSNLKATNAELALVGVETILQQDNDTYIVQYMDGNKVTMNGEEVEKLIDAAKG